MKARIETIGLPIKGEVSSAKILKDRWLVIECKEGDIYMIHPLLVKVKKVIENEEEILPF